eukprot:5438780-Amphidinium_carterae.1
MVTGSLHFAVHAGVWGVRGVAGDAARRQPCGASHLARRGSGTAIATRDSSTAWTSLTRLVH